MEDSHQYEVNLKYKSGSEGLLSSPDLAQSIEVAIPPGFPMGVADIWSPEHLFIASVNACLMTTFLVIAQNAKLEFISFESSATGTVEKVEGFYKVTEITLKPLLTVPYTVRPDRAQRILEMSKKNCLITNSINTTVYLEPRVVQSA
jgi:organic hydroperoxide reductase OsmC/OhrA